MTREEAIKELEEAKKELKTELLNEMNRLNPILEFLSKLIKTSVKIINRRGK